MKSISILSALLFFSTALLAQFSIDNEYSTMEIEGTSNVHDWTEVVETIQGKVDASFEGNTLVKISKLNVTIPVKSIKSGKSTMDKNTYNAMNESKYPNIQFNLKSASISGDKVLCTGTLTIAGKSKDITVACTYTVEPAKKRFTITGSHSMKMTTFGIEPPVAMLGAMRTGDDIKINFSFVIIKSK